MWHSQYLNASSLDPECEILGAFKRRAIYHVAYASHKLSVMQGKIHSHDHLPTSSSQRLRFCTWDSAHGPIRLAAFLLLPLLCSARDLHGLHKQPTTELHPLAKFISLAPILYHQLQSRYAYESYMQSNTHL